MERVTRAFLFHEALATQDEGASLEESIEHVLWYYPHTASPRERVKHVGLAQALLSFAGRFEQEPEDAGQSRTVEPNDGEGDGKFPGKRHAGRRSLSSGVETVRTRHHCHGFLQCEPGVWLVMVMKNRRPPTNGGTPGDNATGTVSSSAAAVSPPSVTTTTATTSRSPPNGGPPTVGSRLRTAVFGRAVLAREPNLLADRGSEPGVLAADAASPASRGKTRERQSLRGGGSAGGEDWIDETALRSAMATAYETFALLHGPVQRALDAPVLVPDPGPDFGPVFGSGLAVDRRGSSPSRPPTEAVEEAAVAWEATEGGDAVLVGAAAPKASATKFVGEREGEGGTQRGRIYVGGGEVMRRLAATRKRLRRARRDLDEAPMPTTEGHAMFSEEQQQSEMEIPADGADDGGGNGGGGSSSNEVCSKSTLMAPSPELELLQKRVSSAEEEVACILQLSPAEKLRETLSRFFDVSLPGAGLSQPHFHLDMGYPQSLPMDSYRRQLGLSMQRRLRDRIRTGFLRRVTGNRGGRGARPSVHIRHNSINIILSIAGGALLLACPGVDGGRERDSCASTGPKFVGDESGVIGDGSGGEVGVGRPGEAFVAGDDDRNTAGVAEQDARGAFEEEAGSGGGDGYFGGREASLVFGYLAAVSAAASVAAASAAVTVTGSPASPAAAGNSGGVRASVADDVPAVDGGALASREGLAAAAASGSGNGGGDKDGDGRRSVGASDGSATPVDAKGDTVVVGREGRAGVGGSSPQAERRSKSPRPKNLWKPWRDDNTHDINSSSKNNIENEENGHGDGDTESAAEKNGSGSVGGGATAIASDGQSLLGRDAPWMSLGDGEGLLCRDGGLASSGGDTGGNGRSNGDHAEIWAPRLHPLGPSLVSRSDKSASGDGVPARGRRSRGRRRVVVYLRGGLCALVSFEEASLQLDVGESSVCRQQADVIGEEASGDCGAEETCGSDPDTRCCHGEEEQRRKEGYPDSCGVDPAELMALGETLQSCLAEDPDLAVLEDDALDLYSQTVTPDPAPKPLPTIGGAFGGFRGGGGSVKQTNSSAAGFASPGHLPPQPPLRAVQHRHSPVPCFYGVGLVRPPLHDAPPPTPAPSASTPMQTRPDSGASAAAAAADAVPSPSALPGHVAESAGPSDRDDFLDPAAVFHRALSVTTETTKTAVGCRDEESSGGRDANVAGGEGARRHGGVVSCVPVGGRIGRRQRPWAGAGTGCGEGFKALMEAFSRRGRPDLGVEDLRMQCLLGRGHQQLAALDDIHASLRDPGCYRKADRGGSGCGSDLPEKNCLRNGHKGNVKNGGEEGERVDVTGHDFDDGASSTAAVTCSREGTEVEQESGVDINQQQQKQGRQQGGEREQEHEDQSSKTLNNDGAHRQWNPPPPPEEIGIRTSMSKGNRWIIGRRVTPGQSGGGGELLAIIEAPILSVGDARAAVKRRFVGAGGGGSGSDDGKTEGVGGHASAGKSSGRTLTSRLR